jgi:acyl-CoA thioester hydrolase
MENNKKEVYSFLIKVKKKDIDNLNHVNNIQYLNWVLKAAEEHWNFVTKKQYNQNFAWVVFRHEIDYLKPAMLHDEISVTTWIENNYGVKSERLVYIKRNQELLVKAKTIWVFVNKKSMKPARIPQEISKLFL